MGALKFGGLQTAYGILHRARAQPLTSQFLLDTGSAELGGAAVNDRFDHPLIVDKAFALQLV